MDMRSPMPSAPLAANLGRASPSEPEIEIDLDRIVYDPAYRRFVRDQLNRAAQTDTERG